MFKFISDKIPCKKQASTGVHVNVFVGSPEIDANSPQAPEIHQKNTGYEDAAKMQSTF